MARWTKRLTDKWKQNKKNYGRGLPPTIPYICQKSEILDNHPTQQDVRSSRLGHQAHGPTNPSCQHAANLMTHPSSYTYGRRTSFRTPASSFHGNYSSSSSSYGPSPRRPTHPILNSTEDKDTNHNRRAALTLISYYYNNHDTFSGSMYKDW